MENKNKLQLTIGLFGNGGVGKSSITTRFIRNQFIDYYDQGIDDDYKYIDLNDKKIRFTIIDTAGQEEFQILVTSYVRSCDLVALVYSITDRNSFQDIIKIHERNQQVLDADDYPKILIGNKNDLFTKREVKTKEGKELAKKLNCKYIETSAKTNENVYQSFYQASLVAFEELKKKEIENRNEKKNKKGKCLLM